MCAVHRAHAASDSHSSPGKSRKRVVTATLLILQMKKPQSSHIALGKPVHLSEPQFLASEMGMMMPRL